jgi:hypothetical protein
MSLKTSKKYLLMIWNPTVYFFIQTVLDALDKTTQEVAELCSHLMPIQDKATVMASSSTEFQWLAGTFIPH